MGTFVAPHWLTCTTCGAMWVGYDVACFACDDGEGAQSLSPLLNSQTGYVPHNFDDPRPPPEENRCAS